MVRCRIIAGRAARRRGRLGPAGRSWYDGTMAVFVGDQAIVSQVLPGSAATVAEIRAIPEDEDDAANGA